MKLQSIEAARGVAALMVVAFHAERALSLPQYVGHMPLGGATAFMHTGVDFFFVLSGYIIFAVHRVDIGRPAALGRYAMRRMTRILPPYWAATAIAVLLALPGHGLPSPGSVAGSLLLVPHAQGPILDVAWTLEREALFYLLFAAAILDRRLGVILVAVWMALSVAGADLGGWAFDEYSALFAFGIAAAAIPSRVVPRPVLLALIGATAFVALGLAENAGLLTPAGWLPRMAYGSASAGVIVGLAASERTGLIRVGRMLGLLGAASYAIYLTHTLVLGLAARVVAEVGLLHLMPDGLAMAACCGAAVATGLAFHRLVEVRLTALVRRAGRHSSNPPGPARTLTG